MVTEDDIRSRLWLYTQAMFLAVKGSPIKPNPHQLAICDALERVVIGKTKRLILNIPPRSGKTEIAVKMFISWAMGVFPDAQFIHTSYSKRLATSNAYGVRALMQHEYYQHLFPQTELEQGSAAKDDFRTTSGGIVYAVGAGGTITGYGAGGMDGRFKGAIVIDDPHKADEATSEVMRQNTIDWFQTTLESRKNSPDTPIILIMQRLHENDLAGWLLAGGNGEKWECVKIPAIDDDGDSFWPEQFPLDMLHRLETANPYIFAGQYMQNPAPKTGGVFDAHKIEIIDALPAGVTGKVRGWDLAATAKGGDWTAGVLLDVSGGFTYIVDIQRIRGSAHDVEQLLVSTAKQDGAGIEQSIPQDPGQAGKAQADYLSKRLIGANFKFSVESGDKATRASPFSAQVNAGNVKMLKAPWNNDILHELRSFPFGSHDDMIDGCSRAFNRIDKPRGGFMFGRA